MHNLCSGGLGLAPPVQDLHRDRARPAHICTGTGLTPSQGCAWCTTSAAAGPCRRSTRRTRAASRTTSTSTMARRAPQRARRATFARDSGTRCPRRGWCGDGVRAPRLARPLAGALLLAHIGAEAAHRQAREGRGGRAAASIWYCRMPILLPALELALVPFPVPPRLRPKAHSCLGTFLLMHIPAYATPFFHLQGWWIPTSIRIHALTWLGVAGEQVE